MTPEEFDAMMAQLQALHNDNITTQNQLSFMQSDLSGFRADILSATVHSSYSISTTLGSFDVNLYRSSDLAGLGVWAALILSLMAAAIFAAAAAFRGRLFGNRGKKSA